MFATAIITFAIAGLAMLPGLLLLRGDFIQPGQRAAAATASLVAMMLATALLGELAAALGLGGLPALAMVPISLTATLAAWARYRVSDRNREPFEWQGLPFATALVAYGLFSLDLATARSAGGDLLVHNWYNADWFKHLAHVHGLANYGVPARDIFGGGERLHYYWLLYVLPGAGTAAGGDAWAALAATNAVITALFGLTFYGLIRSVGPSPGIALAVAFLAALVTAPVTYFLRVVGGTSRAELMLGDAPDPALLALSQVIPQHTLVVAMLLGWALLHRPGSAAGAPVRILSLVSLSASLVVSTLLGAISLTAYGLARLWQGRLRSMPELLLMVVAAALLVLVLGVLQPANPDSALESPLFGNTSDAAWFMRVPEGLARLFGAAGLALLTAIFVFRFWKPSSPAEYFARILAVSLVLAAALWVAVTQALLPPRIAIETIFRARIALGIGVALVGAWALNEAWIRKGATLRWAAAVLTVLVIVALPAAAIRAIWLNNLGDRYTTTISATDLRVLAELRRASDPRDRVWQYPESPFAASPGGDDSWAPIIAGRTVANSLRATNYAAAQPYLEQSKRYFAGEAVAVPDEMDWVYLSRALHPESYDMLLARLEGSADWTKRACYPAACLFERSRASKP